MNTEGKKIICGIRESRKALLSGRAAQLYLACDAAENVVSPLRDLATEKGVPTHEDATMRELGKAAGIAIGAGAIVILK